METMGSVAEVRDTPSPGNNTLSGHTDNTISGHTDNTKSSPDYNSPVPEMTQEAPASDLEEDRTSDEKPVGQAQYYFGDHVIEKRAERGESDPPSETKVKFNLDLRSAMFSLSPSHPPRLQLEREGLSSLDILPENTNPSLNRARMRRLFESQSQTKFSNKSRQRKPKE